MKTLQVILKHLDESSMNIFWSYIVIHVIVLIVLVMKRDSPCIQLQTKTKTKCN